MGHPARVGLLHFGGPGPVLEVLRSGLRQLGYVEGENVVLDPRYAEGQLDRFTDFAADLCRLEVDVIVALGGVAARAAQKATTTIPIVFAVVIDPVAAGFGTTLERPGGNLTGMTSFDPQQPTLQVELLKQVIPTLSRVALLSDGDIPRAADGSLNPLERASETAARELGLWSLMVRVRGPSPNLEDAFSLMIKEGAEAVMVLEVPVTLAHQKRIADLAITHRLPTMFPGGLSSAGGLITFGTTIVDTWPRIPEYVDKILKGAKPAELPITVTTRRELIFNLATAQALGLTIPRALLLRADHVTR